MYGLIMQTVRHSVCAVRSVIAWVSQQTEQEIKTQAGWCWEVKQQSLGNTEGK